MKPGILFHDIFDVRQPPVFGHTFNYYPEGFGYIIVIKGEDCLVLLMRGNHLWVPVERGTYIPFFIISSKIAVIGRIKLAHGSITAYCIIIQSLARSWFCIITPPCIDCDGTAGSIRATHKWRTKNFNVCYI